MSESKTSGLPGTAFITGATGFLGYEIASQLVDAGVEVSALSRSGELPGTLAARGVRIVHGDLGAVATLREAMRPGGVVFHVAADVNMWRHRWSASVDANVLGTRNMVEAALVADVARFVFTSSVSTIGKPEAREGPGPVVVDEGDAYNLHAFGMVYPHSKWLAEQEVERGIENGLDAITTHPAAIFGPRDWKHNTLPYFLGPKRRLTLAVARGFRNTCDVRDVAAAHLAAVVKGRSGGRYILAGECLSVKELFALLAEEVGGTRPLLELPDRAVLAVGRIMDAVADLTDRRPALSWEMALQGTFRVQLSSEKAERMLGYRSRPLRESIRDAVAWFRSRGVL
jgi:dihydroflavonol-4-reductase